MLSVDKGYRKRGIGVYCLLAILFRLLRLLLPTRTASALVRHSISVMQASGAQEVSHLAYATSLPQSPNPTILVSAPRYFAPDLSPFPSASIIHASDISRNQ